MRDVEVSGTTDRRRDRRQPRRQRGRRRGRWWRPSWTGGTPSGRSSGPPRRDGFPGGLGRSTSGLWADTVARARRLPEEQAGCTSRSRRSGPSSRRSATWRSRPSRGWRAGCWATRAPGTRCPCRGTRWGNPGTAFRGRGDAPAHARRRPRAAAGGDGRWCGACFDELTDEGLGRSRRAADRSRGDPDEGKVLTDAAVPAGGPQRGVG